MTYFTLYVSFPNLGNTKMMHCAYIYGTGNTWCVRNYATERERERERERGQTGTKFGRICSLVTLVQIKHSVICNTSTVRMCYMYTCIFVCKESSDKRTLVCNISLDRKYQIFVFK